MKFKNLLICAVALATFASCTKDEPAKVPDVEISFSAPIVGPVTKVVTGKITTYPKEQEFSVYAVYNENKGRRGWGNGSLYINQEDFGFDGTNSWRSTREEYYWPKNGYLTFAAYSPAGLEGCCRFATEQEPGHYCSRGYSNRGLYVGDFKARNIDFLFSERAYDKNFANQDDAPQNPTYSGVDIKFHHALASIKFKIKKGNIDDNTSLKITKLKVKDLWLEGDFFENITSEIYNPDSKWSDGCNRSPYWVYGGIYDSGLVILDTDIENGQLLTSSLEYVKSNSGKVEDNFVLPQEFVHTYNDELEDIKLIIEFTIDPPGYGTKPILQHHEISFKDMIHKYNGTSGENQEIEWGQGRWDMGYEYTYNIIINLNEIRLEPLVEEWQGVEGNVQVPNGNTMIGSIREDGSGW